MTVRDVENGFSLNVTKTSELDALIQSLYENGKPRHVDSSVLFGRSVDRLGCVCLFANDSLQLGRQYCGW